MVRGRNAQFTFLTLVASLAAYARFSVNPLQESIRAALDLTDNRMALIQGPALAVPMMIAALPLGVLIDRFCRVRLMMVFALVSLLGGALTAVAPNFALLFVARGLVGLAVTTISTTVFSLLADLFPPAQRGRASMVIIVGQYIGMSAAFAMAGALVARFESSPSGWRWAMLYLSVPLLGAIVALMFMREPPRSGLTSDDVSARTSIKELWSYRRTLVPLLVGLVFAEIAVLGTLTWAAPALSRAFPLLPDRIGFLMSAVVLVSGVVGPVTGGVVADLCQRAGGPRRTLVALALLALCTVPASFFAVVPSVAVAAALLMCLMALVGAILVAGIALFTIVIANDMRGLSIATLTGTEVLFGVALAPMIVSGASGALGGPAMIGWALAVVCGVSMLISGGAFVVGIRLKIGECVYA